MLEYVFGQSAPAQLLVAPLVDGEVDIRHRPPQCCAVLSGEAVQILRPRSGEFISLADVLQRIEQHGDDHVRDVLGRNRRRPSRTEGQPNRAVASDLLSGPGEEEEILLKHGRPDMDDGQAGPVQRLLGKPMLALLP